MIGHRLLLLIVAAAVAPSGCATDAPSAVNAQALGNPQIEAAERVDLDRGRDIWFENTYGGEKFFAFLAQHPDPAKRLKLGFEDIVNTPRADRFEVWGVINDPDCRANPQGGADLCDTPSATGVVGVRKFADGNGGFIFGAACASCHAGFDPVKPPIDPAEPTWDNIHATIGNQYLDFGALFSANLAPTDPRALMFNGWPRGAVDTTLLFNDNIMNPGTVTAFWEHPNRPHFDVGLGDSKLRNGQGGEDDVGGDLAALRVYTNIGVCFFECVAGPAQAEAPIDIDTCRQTCSDFPPQRDLDDLTAFLASIEAPELPRDSRRGFLYYYGRYQFDQNCESCHDRSGRQRHVLSNDEVNPLVADPANATNACRALTSNWEEGQVWAQFSSDGYKELAASGNKGYRTMPLAGIWSTTPLLHNQSIGELAPATATPRQRALYFWDAMWELLSDEREPKVNTLPVALGPFPAGTPLTYVFSRDPATGQLLCDDTVENRGHYFGSELPVWDKLALIYWLQYQ